jgi:hypothetical protein
VTLNKDRVGGIHAAVTSTKPLHKVASGVDWRLPHLQSLLGKKYRSCCMSRVVRSWRAIAAQVSTERNQGRFNELVKELSEALDAEEERKPKAVRHPAPTENS